MFFKVCKSYLRLGKECNALSFDAMTAHTAVIFTRYMMLSLENRESTDKLSLGELFHLCSDELSDITWLQAFQLLLQLFKDVVSENCGLSEAKITDMVDNFINAIPLPIKSKLQIV